MGAIFDHRLTCPFVVPVKGRQVDYFHNEPVCRGKEVTDPLHYLESQHKLFKVHHSMGCLFSMVVWWATLVTTLFVMPSLNSPKSAPPDPLDTPDILLMIADGVMVFDNLAGTITLVVNADPQTDDAYQQALARLDAIEALLPKPAPPLEPIALTATDTTAIEPEPSR